MKIIDLSHNLEPLFINDKSELANAEIRSVLCYLFKPDPSVQWHIAHLISISSHIGTHIESPYHWMKDGADIASIPLESLIGPAVKLDLSYKKRGEKITVEDVMGASKGRLRSGDIVFLQTNHSELWGTEEYWDESPYLSVDAAKWLVENKVKVVGIDGPRLDCYRAQDRERYIIHGVLHGNGVLVIENMVNLDKFKDRGTAFILPVKVCGIDAFPVRIIVIEED
ncbi:TPA: cyclase family protein [Candidatus Bathyarchaeota archaeon]|nr:cyclase family protein [Candidatus Bathyarchaeota archaeon]